MIFQKSFGDTRQETRWKTIVLSVLSVVASIAIADDGSTTTYQTLPNSAVRDYGAPAHVTEGNTTYRTLPGSSIGDYSAPSYVTRGDTTFQTLPGSSVRDYSAPVYVVPKQRK